MAKSKSKKNNGSETWPVDSGDQTTFLPGKKFPLSGIVGSSRAVYPNPQFIGNMPQQLAGYTDSGNTKGRPASGVGPNWPYNFNLSKPLDFRGVNKVYVNADAVNKRPGMVRDYLAQNKKLEYKNETLIDKGFERGPSSTYVMSDEMAEQGYRLDDNGQIVKGINDWARTASKYFNKPFVVGDISKLGPSTAIGRDLILDVVKMSERDEYRGAAGVSYGDWDRPLSTSGKNNKSSKKESPYDSRYRSTVALSKNLTATRGVSNVMAHEFGHVLGQGHAHNVGGAPRNSIMSYETPRRAYTEPSQLGPADINYFKKTMGYDRTPKQIVKKLDAGIMKYNDGYSETNIFKHRGNVRF
jgi:hypothetical protein